MKINDIVFDKEYGIGIINNIEQDIITVLFYSGKKVIYENDFESLKIISEEFIDNINLYVNNLNYNKNEAIKANMFTFKIIDFNNAELNVELSNSDKIKLFFDRYKKVRIIPPYNYYNENIEYIFWQIKEQIDILNLIDEECLEPCNELLSLTKQFIDQFFDFTLFNKLSDLIAAASLNTLIYYCEKTTYLDIKNQLKKYLLFLVANNTRYLESLCAVFQKVPSLHSDLFWALKRGHYFNDTNYALNASILLLRENKNYEWAKIALSDNNYSHVLDHERLEHDIFIAVIKEASDTLPYWDLYKGIFRIHFLDDLILENSNKENIIKILENKKVEKISEDTALKLDIDTLIKYANLTDSHVRESYINKYKDELLEKEPKKVIDLLMIQADKWYCFNTNLIDEANEYLPDNKYLKAFINDALINHRFFVPNNIEEE